jgi:peptidoglycan/LPS O-acetylase OafA/YrhL
MASGTAATLSQTTSTPATLNHFAAERLPLQKAGNTLFLDGMRGLAALYVLMRHVTWVPAPESSGIIWRRILAAIEHVFRYGHMAVIFFFVLSGFVIHLRYAKQLQNDPAGAKFDWGEFVFRRVKRLYPPLIAAILVTSVFDYVCGALGFHHFYALRGPASRDQVQP